MSNEHCVNCDHILTGIQSHTLEPEHVTIIEQIIAPQQVSENDIICHNCWEELQASLVTPKQETESVICSNRCIYCQRSIRRIRSHLLQTNTERENSIRNVIIKWMQPQEITSSSRICHPCWQRADRAAVRFTQDTAEVSTLDESEIFLPNYTRAANTERRCIFADCDKAERIRIPTSLRVKLFCEFSFYVPPNCRICKEHLRSDSWNDLIDIENGNHVFTSTFIEDFVELLKRQ